MRFIPALIYLFITAVLFMLPRPANAFYEFGTGDTSFEARGFIRLAGSANDNPNIDSIYENNADYSAGGAARLLLDGGYGDNVAFELNLFQSLRASTAAVFLSSEDIRKDVERSSILEWDQIDQDKTTASLELDRVNLRLTYDRLDVTIGRQAVNLATTYYFTPNDFFAPFSAQTFFRVYKPGVDAVRVEARMGELSQLTLLGVLGYKENPNTISGWSDEIDWNRFSPILRVTTVALNFEWGLMGGQVRGADMIAGSIQGEIPLKIGVRLEGHYIYPETGPDNNLLEFSAELERRFDNSLALRIAWFYHGAGADRVEEYALTGGAAYLARDYMAFGASYEFTPILYGETLLLTNLVDDSYQLSFYTVYSLNDDTEFSAGLSIPSGDEPSLSGGGSEFGAYPVSFNMEIRSYF